VQVQNREFQSCGHCRSSLRMRSIVHALSLALYGRSIPLPEFRADKRIAGLGISDWEGYARGLAEKFSYTNTYYHQEPRLDITAVPGSMVGQYRFLISSDVFEHIAPEGLEAAFANSRRLLRKDGVFVFTVPFAREAETREHFPRLHDWRIEERDGRRVLVNTTASGERETFEDLVFHGGDGMTLEMRVFGEKDLRRRLAAVGYSKVQVGVPEDLRYGIAWPIDHSPPIVARP
jgi:SAM-dependent methyltransferase